MRKYVKCDGVSCRDRDQFHTHHMTRWGVFWWWTFPLHRGGLRAVFRRRRESWECYRDAASWSPHVDGR